MARERCRFSRSEIAPATPLRLGHAPLTGVAERLPQRGLLLAVERVSLTAAASCLGGVHQATRGGEAAADRRQLDRQLQHLATPAGGLASAREPPRSADVTLRSAGGKGGVLGRYALGLQVRATASYGGIRSVTRRHRDRTVGSRSSDDGAQSSHTPRGGGSSSAFSNALSACSVNRSASSMTVTCQRPRVGASAARATSRRVSATLYDSPVGITISTSAWVPASAVWHSWQLAAATIRALQRGRERPRRHRASRSGWAGEQPGVCHRCPRLAADHGGRGGRRGDELSDHVVLTDQGVEPVHSLMSASDRPSVRPDDGAGGSSGPACASTMAAIWSGLIVASRTR